MAPTINPILDFINNLVAAISPIFFGSGWRPLVFQAFAIIIPSFSSVFSIISAQESSVIILSQHRLRLATLAIGLLYLACHQIIVHLLPVNPGWLWRIGFALIVFIAITLIPYHTGNLITSLIQRLGDGPYVIEVDEQASQRDDLSQEGFWKPGPNFVRRVVARYYQTGLFFPAILLFLFAGIAPLQLLVLLVWIISTAGLFVMLTFRDPDRFFYVLLGYLALIYLGSNYFVYKW